MNRIRVVGLGLACLDIIIRTSQLPSWEKGSRLSAVAVEGGGPAATGIVAAQRLGVPTGFIGTYGSDRIGKIKLQTIAENGVDVSRMVQREEQESQVVLVAVQEETGERIFSGAQKTSPELAISEIDRAYITSADFLHLDGYHSAAAWQAAHWMKEAGRMVMMDGSSTSGPISAEMHRLAGTVDILICGKGFGQALTGEADLWKSGRLMRRMGPRIVVQTEGIDGSYTVCDAGEFHVPAFEVDVVDTTGAGDVFHGAFWAGLLQGWDTYDTVVFSTAVAGIKCTQLSGRRGIPTFEETMDFLSERGISLGK